MLTKQRSLLPASKDLEKGLPLMCLAENIMDTIYSPLLCTVKVTVARFASSTSEPPKVIVRVTSDPAWLISTVILSESETG